MILVFDVGNTELTIGLYDGPRLEAHWRIMTDVARTADELGVLLRSLLAARALSPERVDGAAIGSVVPRVTRPLVDACEQYFPVGKAVVVDASSGLPITLDVDEPLTVGADRIINTLAASRIHERDAIVVDMGTATTYDCITADGVFLGGVIAPGIMTSAETLTRRTSKLPATELIVPARVIGRRTEECIRAGVLFGGAEAIDGIVRRIKRAWPRPAEPMVIATGGFAETMAPLCEAFDRVEPYLTLAGLQLAHALLTGSSAQV
ncbi:MAG TPA: type III pantothenate kinase [Gemmatimonadaceae bacterium]|nr:type III pantothenate kinase [Gemmatimonadaceae bacterium]